MVYLVFDDDIECECYGNEAVYHNGEHHGLTTSGAFGHRVGKSLAFAYVPSNLMNQGEKFQVLTTLGMRDAHIELEAVYDTSNQLQRI